MFMYISVINKSTRCRVNYSLIDCTSCHGAFFLQKKSCQEMATLNKHEDIKRESIKSILYFGSYLMRD